MFLFFTAILLLNNMFIDYYLTNRTEDLIVNVIVPDVIHPYDDVPIILVVTNNGKESVGIRNPSYYWNFHPRLYHDDVLINSFGIRVKPDPKAKKIIETIAPGETRKYLLPHSFNALFYTDSFEEGVYSLYFILELKDGTSIVSDTTVFSFCSY